MKKNSNKPAFILRNMDADERWEGEPVETATFGGDGQQEDEPSTAKKIWNRFFGVFVSITIGVYAGLMCRTMQEAWIYSALFCGEALVCACVAGIIKTYSFKRSITTFAIYFVISAISTPVSCWLGFQFA